MLCFNVSRFFSIFSGIGFAAEHNRIKREQIVYEGAIRPFYIGWRNHETFAYGMSGLTFNPKGYPDGPNDGYPGSLFAVGHRYEKLIAETSIPIPVKSKDYNALPRGEMLQGFGDISEFSTTKASIAEYLGSIGENKLEIDQLAGLVYVPGMSGKSRDFIFWTVKRYYNAGNINHPSIGRSEPDTEKPQVKGVWRLGPRTEAEFHAKSYSNYLFSIPEDWSEMHVGGKSLAAGMSGCPSTRPTATVRPCMHSPPYLMKQFPPWALPWKPKSFCGIHPIKENIPDGRNATFGAAALGFAPGIDPQCSLREPKGWGRYGTGNHCPVGCSSRKGYHCDPIEGQIVLYDPEELAEVASGDRETWDVLPYEIISYDDADLPFDTCSALGDVAYDPDANKLYMVQRIQGGKPLIHVFRIESISEGAVPSSPSNLQIENIHE